MIREMRLARAFEDCLQRITGGEAVAESLKRYPKFARQLVPLLYTAVSIETMPKAKPSPELRISARARLLSRLRHERSPEAGARGNESLLAGMAGMWQVMQRILAGPARVTVTLTLALVLIIEGFLLLGAVSLFSPPAALASRATLTTLTGGVEFQRAGSTVWEKAGSGITMEAGTTIRTSANSHAVLTFFEGTTLRIEPGTVMTVKELEGAGQDQPTRIVLKQYLGRTLSRVTKLVDPASNYGIETPSGYAVVRGTVFVTEVDEDGTTRVETFEGLVSVSAEGEEMLVPAGTQTTIAPGGKPSEAAPTGHSEGLNSPAQGTPAHETAEKEKDNSSAAGASASPPADNGGKPAPGMEEENASPEDIDRTGREQTARDKLLIRGEMKYDTRLIIILMATLVFSLGLTAVIWSRH